MKNLIYMLFSLSATLGYGSSWMCITSHNSSTNNNLAEFTIDTSKDQSKIIELDQYHIHCAGLTSDTKEHLSCVVRDQRSSLYIATSTIPTDSGILNMRLANLYANSPSVDLSCEVENRTSSVQETESEWIDTIGATKWIYLGKMPFSIAEGACAELGFNMPNLQQLASVRVRLLESKLKAKFLESSAITTSTWAMHNSTDSSISYIDLRSGSVDITYFDDVNFHVFCNKK